MKNNAQTAPTTLFDEIYRSTDRMSTRSLKKQALRVDTGKKHSRNDMARPTGGKVEAGEQQKRCLIDDWMERKRIITTRRSDNDQLFFSPSSSSSHSSSPALSSSDNESRSLHQAKNRESCFPPLKRKQNLTTLNSPASKPHQNYSYCSESANQEISLKSESRALKMYADLKKSKLPVSPGAKLTSFLNSVFNGRRSERKASEAAADDFKNPKSRLSYTCSSASSSTRSCLVKKSPLLAGDKSVKKSVRFYPTNIEYSAEIRSRNVEHSPSSIYNRKDENLGFSSMDEDDTEDAASDASSELFEIDHIIFAAINSNSHGHELPVFETTNVNSSNRAISIGGIVF